MKIKSISEPKIVKIHIDLENKLKQGEKISVQFMGGAMIPKEDDDENCFASMNLLMKNTSDKIIVSLLVQSKVVCPVTESGKKSRQDLIKTEVFPKLIDKIKEIYNLLGEDTIVKLPNFPELNLN